MKRILWVLVGVLVFAVSGVAHADMPMLYSFEGTLSGVRGFGDNAGIIASSGLGIGSPLDYTFLVNFSSVGTMTLNDGTVVPYSDDSFADYFYADYLLGSALQQKDGGYFNADSYPAEYNVGKDSLAGDISYLLGNSEDDAIQIFSRTTLVSDWVVGTELEVYNHAFDSQGDYSFFFGDLRLTETNVIPEPASILLFATGIAGTFVRRKFLV